MVHTTSSDSQGVFDFSRELAPPPPIKWPTRLFYRQGSEVLLAGIKVWHDFDWESVFGHNRSTFTNGRRLAEFIKDKCPVPKEANLVLTQRSEISEIRHVETDDDFIVVINIDDYRGNSDANPFLSFLARSLGEPVADIAELRKLACAPKGIATIAQITTTESISQWVADYPQRVGELIDLICHATRPSLPGEQLARIVSLVASSCDANTVARLLRLIADADMCTVLKGLERLDVDSIQSLSSLVGISSLGRMLAIWGRQHRERR